MKKLFAVLLVSILFASCAKKDEFTLPDNAKIEVSFDAGDQTTVAYYEVQTIESTLPTAQTFTTKATIKKDNKLTSTYTFTLAVPKGSANVQVRIVTFYIDGGADVSEIVIAR